MKNVRVKSPDERHTAKNRLTIWQGYSRLPRRIPAVRARETDTSTLPAGEKLSMVKWALVCDDLQNHRRRRLHFVAYKRADKKFQTVTVFFLCPPFYGL